MTNRDLKAIVESLRERFIPERTEGWITLIHFEFEDAGALSLSVEMRELSLEEGLEGDPLSVVRTDLETFDDLFSGRIPLELALMKDRFRTDNLVEIFKLQTVFEKESR